ncbi:MAG: putative hydroxymethylpyrimidine transporter CytX [Clostridiales bacterium]|jgi:putative hydroxymethylpyrimidine transporter CytX|nr:putative hydroxymethylpyrimidine transporter CytX [Eubacteriales bacterium]MDH7565685.1 putative hydroxymethylpyrimidine transporter CytX [Clostridiales bacterium]
MDDSGKKGGFSFFALWFGAAVSMAEIMTGSLIAPLGIIKGIAAIVSGHLIGCLILSSVGLMGFRERKPSLMASRISLGRYGSYVVSVFNIIQLTGWTAVMLIQCARSLQPVTAGLLGISSSFQLLVVIVGILVGIWALTADRGINFINNAAVVLLGILSIVMFILVLKGGEVKTVAESMSFGAALELSIVMPLSWVPLISDYTMTGKSATGSFAGSFLGYFTGSSFMYIIGLASAIYTGNSDTVGIMTGLGMGYAALLIVVLATVTTTFLDVYSSVLSTLNLAPRMSKKKLIVIFTGIGTLLALFFPMEQYENFLYMIGSLFAPAFSVIIADYFFYRKDRSADYVNVCGIIAAILGTAGYYAFNRLDLVIGSSIPSMLFTVALYAVMRFVLKKFQLGEDKYVKQNG